MKIEKMEVQDREQARAWGRNGGFTPQSIELSYEKGLPTMTLIVRAKRSGQGIPLLLQLSESDMHKLADLIKGDKYIEDALIIFENEGINPKILEDYPKLAEDIQKYWQIYDASNYMDGLQEYIESEAESMGIDLEDYKEDEDGD